MCDYSLHAVASRPARVGDKLVTSKFPRTDTRGFSAIGEPDVAVCLLPGTEIAFDTALPPNFRILRMCAGKLRNIMSGEKTVIQEVGRFRYVEIENPTAHHDAIEFPNGEVMLLTGLRPGQRATVLQLPARPKARTPANERADAANSASPSATVAQGSELGAHRGSIPATLELQIAPE
jgi:hypothetical protein